MAATELNTTNFIQNFNNHQAECREHSAGLKQQTLLTSFKKANQLYKQTAATAIEFYFALVVYCNWTYWLTEWRAQSRLSCEDTKNWWTYFMSIFLSSRVLNTNCQIVSKFISAFQIQWSFSIFTKFYIVFTEQSHHQAGNVLLK